MDGSKLYIVRVWSERVAFRASVRAVDREETQVFAEPAALLQFLCSADPVGRPTPPQSEEEGSTS